MLDHSADYASAMLGSFTPLAQVDAWVNGQLVADKMPVVSGSVTMDSTSAVHTSGSFTFATDDDSLIPDALGLGPLGVTAQLHVRMGMQIPNGPAELLSCGWLRIVSGQTKEYWQQYRKNPTDPVQVAPRGVTLSIGQAQDAWAALSEDQFLAPEQPPSLTSVIAEITRLAQHTGVTISDLSGITDKAIPQSTVWDYTTDRGSAIQTLADLLNMTARINMDGALSLVPKAVTDLSTPDWEVTVAADAVSVPLLQQFSRQWDRAQIGANAVRSIGTAADGTQLIGWATETEGPFAYGGPYGQVVEEHDSPLIATAAQATADAATYLANLRANRVAIVPITVPANHALETLDVMAVTIPAGDGTYQITRLTGWVQKITATVGATTMQVDLAVPRSSL